MSDLCPLVQALAEHIVIDGEALVIPAADFAPLSRLFAEVPPGDVEATFSDLVAFGLRLERMAGARARDPLARIAALAQVIGSAAASLPASESRRVSAKRLLGAPAMAARTKSQTGSVFTLLVEQTRRK